MGRPDPIVAPATAGGRAAIGVIRLSGPDLGSFLIPLIGQSLAPRVATLVDFLDSNAEPLDTGIALYFPAPCSYTGEDVLELQGHGGPAVVQMVLRRCIELGARLAEPGEFTKRAFLNGKLDLAQAESVADLIDAGSGAAAKSALRSLHGDFSKRINSLVEGVTDLRVRVEACIDFPEDEHVDLLVEQGAAERLQALQGKVQETLEAASSGRLLRDGLRVVLIGRPNVGKSSLLNRFVGEEVAIVSEMPGTTRDTLREHLVIGGLPIHLTDTAGLRASSDPVEVLGISRAKDAMGKADLVLAVLDASEETEEDERMLASIPADVGRLLVRNKIDRIGVASRLDACSFGPQVWVSALSGEGLELLKAEILRQAGFHPGAEGVFVARERHLDALRRAQAHLRSASELKGQLELFAEELRLAQEALSEITGRMSADDLLGEIFSRFCIGK